MNHLEDGIDSKVDKVEDSSTFNRVYGVDTNGKQKIFNISKAPKDSALGQYTSAGNLVTNDPTAALHAANKRYIDGRFDYVVLTNSEFIISTSLDETDRKLLLNFLNKHYGKTNIPLFAIDKNGVIATIVFEDKTTIELYVWSSKQYPIVFTLLPSFSKVKFSSYRPGYLHNILGQNVWTNDIFARIGVNSDNKLIITDKNGKQTPGQEPSVLVPPFTYELNEENKKIFTLDGYIHTDSLYYAFDNNFGRGATHCTTHFVCDMQGYFFHMNLNSGITFFPSETSWATSLGSIEYDENEKHFKFLHEDEKYTINLPAGKSGTVALTSDITSALENNLPFGTNADIDNMF